MKLFLKITIIFLFCFNGVIAQSNKKNKTIEKPAVITGQEDRKFWLAQMDKMLRPVFYNLAQDSLKIVMPQTVSKFSDNVELRKKVAYVEILGRSLSGIAPWLQQDDGDAAEVALRNQYRNWVLQGLSNALDSNAKDFMRFNIADQQLVDGSFIALAFIRAPWLWEHLNNGDKEKMAASLRMTRNVKPVFSNWLLFSGMVEAFFCNYGYEWDKMRIDLTIRQFEQWYRGDGMYSDGNSYSFDYYNSFVIHPFYTTILNIVSKKNADYNEMKTKAYARDERYAIIQERLINADGTYPATGRSIVYRGGAFQHLANMAWQQKLPAQLSPASVRCALTAVIKKTLESPSTYNSNGWLQIGLYGSQPDIADVYNNTGSLYLCTNIFLPLGLSATDVFWTNPAEQWSAQKIWSGQNFPNDHAVK